jgi:hypothetical protein
VKVAALFRPSLVETLKFSLGNSTRGSNIHTELLHFIFNTRILLAFRNGSEHRLHSTALSSETNEGLLRLQRDGQMPC